MSAFFPGLRSDHFFRGRMVDSWYYAQNNKSYGPFSVEQLKALAAKGQIQSRDTVWKEGMETRVVAAKVKNLFAVVVGCPPAVPDEQVFSPVSTPFEEGPEDQEAPVFGPLDVPEDSVLVPLEPEKPKEEPAPEEKPAERAAPRRHEQETRKKRVTTVKGGVLVSQDGVRMKYRKKCIRCGHDDTSVTSSVIQLGCTRANFFCPKCRKNQQTEIYSV